MSVDATLYRGNDQRKQVENIYVGGYVYDTVAKVAVEGAEVRGRCGVFVDSIRGGVREATVKIIKPNSESPITIVIEVANAIKYVMDMESDGSISRHSCFHWRKIKGKDNPTWNHKSMRAEECIDVLNRFANTFVAGSSEEN